MGGLGLRFGKKRHCSVELRTQLWYGAPNTS